MSATFKVWVVSVSTPPSSYEHDDEILDAFQTKAQAYARKARVEKMLEAAKRRVKRWLDAHDEWVIGDKKGAEPEAPTHRGLMQRIERRHTINAVVRVWPLTVTRGVE